MSTLISDGLQRRDFLKAFMAAAGMAAVGSLTAGCAIENGIQADNNSMELTGSATASASSGRFAGLVRPIIGTGWHGHTFPGATMPFGLVQLSPDTVGPPEPKWNGWDMYDWDHYCGGYHYPDNTILGFSHTHISGTGAQELGDVLVMPVVDGRNWGWNSGAPGKEHEAQIEALGSDTGWVSRDKDTGYSSRFSHQQEIVRAGYYSVYLQTPRVKAEVTATPRSGMHRYTYPALPMEKRRGIMLDLVHGLGNAPYHAELTIESPTRISGKRYSHGWAKNRQAYFVMEFSAPIQSYDVLVDGHVTSHISPRPKHFSATRIKAIFQWDHAAVNPDQPLLLRVGISGTGIEGAAKNLATEIPHWDFDALEQQTQQVWNEALGVLDADLPTTELAQTFYSSAYHAMMGPTTFNDVDGTFRGEDFKNHRNPGFTNYTTISIWDIYRGEFPFIMLTQPHRTNDIINTLLADYRQFNEHTLPIWPLWANETWSMTGFNAVAMILGAYTRGFRGYDVEAVYAAMRDTALVGANYNGNKELQAEFSRCGYVISGPATSREMRSVPGKESVSCTLDFAYDYWCVGAMAQLLGKHDDAAKFYKLGQNYKNLFDPKTGFMRGKLANGQWREPFRPDQNEWYDYTESDAWQTTFNVVQDVQGLIDLYGGDKPFIAKIDAFFAARSKVYNYDPDITGMVGQDAQGNEPSNHIPYLYPFAGAAWKTQYWIRKVLGLYNNTPNGIPGNDDIGQISSCFTMGALGFYPVNAATGVYVIGSPLVNRAKINNPATGTTFSIIADNNSPENCYIQSAKLNGKELTRSWFTHGDIVAGGELYFRMGHKPNKDWAAAKADRPPSGLVR
ncbi:MAG: GH92 family glycosyl hydrolase [Planctomycetia bacterium]|nr:GH92 family glycosyl hydrolase [Planctomycetia bacterium]